MVVVVVEEAEPTISCAERVTISDSSISQHEKELEASEGEAIISEDNGIEEEVSSLEPLIDLELVEKVRKLLEIEWNNNENNQAQYSELHYQEIMDKKSPSTCWRYLIHCNLRIEETLESMKSALIWRKQNNADESMNKQLVKEFWFHAPIFFGGLNKIQEDVLYVIGRNYRKPDAKLAPIIKRFTQNLLFTWDHEHRNDLKKVCFVFDVSDTGLRNIDLEFMQWFVSLRDYLPSRISQIYVIGIPLLMRPLIKLIISWLPEKFSKIVECGSFDQLVKTNIELSDLPEEMGGLKPECSYRLAPIDSLWAFESPIFDDETMQKYINDSIWFHVTEERKQRLEDNQREYENKTLKN